MSYTTVIAVWPGEKTEDLEELRNSHGGAPIVWNEMCTRYLGTRKDSYYLAEIDKLWPRYKDPKMPDHHRNVLVMTYDNALVLKADYKRAAADIRAFLADFPQQPNHVNHWPRIAELFESDPDCPAIGFWMTSVSENPFSGTWDEETDEEGPPDWSRYWSVYATTDKYSTKRAADAS